MKGMPKPKYHFEPTKKTKPTEKSFIAFDTETNPDTGEFICGAFYGKLKTSHDEIIIEEVCNTESEFRNKFLEIESEAKKRKRSFILIGFNSSYDMVYLGDIVSSPDRLDAGSRFIQAKTVGGTKIYDISNHVIGSLDDWIKRLRMKERYGIYKREGYLDSISLKEEQVLDDAKATWILSTWVQSRYVNKFGINLPPTKFGAALKIFQTNYFKDKWYRFENEQWKNDFERESYYGGRCEVFSRGLQEVESYDVNSMYVAIMRDEYIPNPSISKYLKDADQIRGLIETDFLTVDCRVRVPKLRIGLLPYRDKKTGKLIFPYGEWRGVYNSIELREALRWGAEITEIYRALWYPESKQYFREYAQMTLDGRKVARLDEDYAEEQLFKYLGNGLYGKFGQRNSEGGQYVRLSQYEGDLEGLRIIMQEPLQIDTAWVELPEVGKSDSWHTFPVIAATITAYARAKLLNALCNNMDTAVYCDTDSIKTIGKPIGLDVGDSPGQWGYEYTEKQVFYRPKRYGDKRKGVPKKAELLYADSVKEIYQYETPIKFKSSIRNGKTQNEWIKQVKEISLIDDKREWITDEISWPLWVYEEPSNIDEEFTEKSIQGIYSDGIVRSA